MDEFAIPLEDFRKLIGLEADKWNPLEFTLHYEPINVDVSVPSEVTGRDRMVTKQGWAFHKRKRDGTMELIGEWVDGMGKLAK